MLLGRIMADEIVIGDIRPPEPGSKIGPGREGAATKPPTGCASLSSGDMHPQLHNIASKFLRNEWGTMVPFRINDKYYMARVEPHYRKPAADPALSQQRKQSKIPEGWHKGVSVYKVLDKQNTNTTDKPTVSKPSGGRAQFLDRLTKLMKEIDPQTN